MKALFTLFFTLFFAIYSYAQIPVNDDCAGLIDLGVVPYCSSVAQYTNVNATASVVDVPAANIPACFNSGVERDVWFKFTVPADGSIVDVEISVFGDVNGNGTMKMPQVAIYRGDCAFGELAELDCAAAPLNVNEVHLQQFGLTPGLSYFLRINDYSATGTPNAGTFKLCVEKYIPEITMGQETNTESCTGTLWDSGGPSGDYGAGEDLTFTICPQEFHQCIIINVEDYDTEQGFDYLSFYQGDDINDLQLTQIAGFGSNFEVQVPAPCATIRFTSDGFGEFGGFKITWTCSPDACTTPPPTTCADPAEIAGLPFSEDGLSNCFSGNTLDGGPCGEDVEFLAGNDYVFSYTSQGDECIQITASGANIGAGIGVYDQCPSLPGANCIASAGGGFASVDPVINAAFLENPGTYYIVFGAGPDCSPFNISVDTVTCPVVLPSASTCDKALNIGGCSNVLPEIIALNPGAGDPNFIVDGVNQGCFVFPQQNYSFFYFTAGADGKFGFTVQSANPDEASDIDFNVWGPIPDAASICDFVSNNQPIRSSWASGADPTGLADEHPILGTPVDDEFDCGSPATPGTDPPPPPFVEADDFVKRIDVQEGEIYVIMLDDFGNAIVQGGISIDFSGTTTGVLDVPNDQITASADTAVCVGQPVQLNATGGAAYFWSPTNSLSCSQCPNPVAIPDQPTSYEVQIVTACNTETRVVNVETVEIELGPDVTVCNNATFTLNENGFQGGQYFWVGPAGLSCYNCPSPTVSGLTTGIYTFVATVFTPQCTVDDTIKITVVQGQQPQYSISNDKILCAGQTVNLGGPGFANTFYQWSSVPSGFISSNPNPAVTPLQTTKYYLVAVNTSCPFPSVDSVLMTVYQPPVLAVEGDTAICNGESVLLGTTIPEPGVTYAWTPDNGTLDDVAIPNPLATPLQTTVYQLTATNPGCVVNKFVQVTVVNFNLTLDKDSVRVCKGTPVPIQATLNPPGGVVTWTPLVGLQVTPNGLSAVATPEEPTLYTASASVPGCVRKETVLVWVDSLPQNLGILPSDTTICQGTQVLLSSPVYEPAEYPIINFQWTPTLGQLTPDSLYNMVVQPDTTTIYTRITVSGACVDSAKAKVTVIEPAEMRVEPADTTICEGKSVALKVVYSPGVTDIEWMPASGLSCTTCDNPIATPSGTTTYTVMGEFQGCPVSASGVVKVRNLPLIQFPDDTQLCGGESVLLNQVFDPTATYNWTSTDPNFVPTTNPQPTVTQTIPSATYTVTANNGCPNSGQVTITVASATLMAAGDTTVCQNFPAKLTASGSLPGTYTWSTGQTGQVIEVKPGATTTYTVVYTYGDNCQLTDQVTVNVQGVGPDVIFPNDTELCPGENVTLNSANTPGATYVWTSTPPGFSFTGANPPPQSPNQSTKYNVTATLGNCTISTSVNIIVYNATLTVSEDQNLCAGETVTLTANGSLTGEYLWSTGQTTASITVAPNQTTTYDVIYTYGDGCTLEDAVKVTVVPNFTLSIAADPDTNRVNIGDPISLMGVVAPSQNLSNFQFQWLENGTENIGNTESIETTPSTNDSTIFYKLIVTSPAGCVQEAQINFTLVQPSVVVPNAFSPNGDAVNDVFRMRILEGSVIVLEMSIYNRWGEKVFSSTDANAAWDGKMSDGKDAPSDVYVYFIRWQRGDGALQPPKKGDVALLR
ncbi:MAG: hypothetical protein OHK0019_29100 [Saprospiraceae bacterium]